MNFITVLYLVAGVIFLVVSAPLVYCDEALQADSVNSLTGSRRASNSVQDDDGTSAGGGVRGSDAAAFNVSRNRAAVKAAIAEKIRESSPDAARGAAQRGPNQPLITGPSVPASPPAAGFVTAENDTMQGSAMSLSDANVPMNA